MTVVPLSKFYHFFSWWQPCDFESRGWGCVTACVASRFTCYNTMTNVLRTFHCSYFKPGNQNLPFKNTTLQLSTLIQTSIPPFDKRYGTKQCNSRLDLPALQWVTLCWNRKTSLTSLVMSYTCHMLMISNQSWDQSAEGKALLVPRYSLNTFKEPLPSWYAGPCGSYQQLTANFTCSYARNLKFYVVDN